MTALLVCAGLLISIDQAYGKSGLVTKADGYCAGFTVTRLLIVRFATLLQAIIFVAEITFYFFIAKCFFCFCFFVGKVVVILLCLAITLISTLRLSTILLPEYSCPSLA